MLSADLVHGRFIPYTTKKVLQAIIDEFVRPGSGIVFDELRVYNDVEKKYIHEVVKHHIRQYLNEKNFHTNSTEDFWIQLNVVLLVSIIW